MGQCEPPEYEGLGGHLNPFGRQHGFESPQGPHAGDLPNIHVSHEGTAEFELFVPGVSLHEGEAKLFDFNGSALDIHAGADDYESDPFGEPGPRIACGVVKR